MELILTISGISILLDFCIDQGQIFGWYKKIIDNYLWFQIRKTPGGGITVPDDTEIKQWKRNIYKVVGGCVFCTHVWLSMLLFFLFSDSFSIFDFISTIVFGHMFLRVFYHFVK